MRFTITKAGRRTTIGIKSNVFIFVSVFYHEMQYMLPVSLVLCTIVAWVDLKYRIGIRLPVYCMRCLCFITQASFLPAFFQAT